MFTFSYNSVEHTEVTLPQAKAESGNVTASLCTFQSNEMVNKLPIVYLTSDEIICFQSSICRRKKVNKVCSVFLI